MNRWDYEEEPIPPGPGVHQDEAVDGDPLKYGHTSLTRGSGSVKGPGSRGPRAQTPMDRLLIAWRASIEAGTFGKITRKTIDRPTFRKNVRSMRTEDLRGIDDPDIIIAESFEMFASDVRHGRVKATGQPMWFVYFGRRHKYLARARGQVAEKKVSEIDEDDTWI